MQLPTSSAMLLQTVCSITSQPIARVQKIHAGSHYPIRAMDERKYEILSILCMSQIATDYTGADPEQCTGAFKECAKLLIEKFGGLGMDEVKEAFAMASVGILGDVNLVSYRGVFTVAMFGAILQAYTVYRNRILWQISESEKMEEMQRRELEMEKKNEVVRRVVIERFNLFCQVNDQIENIDQIPSHWARILRDAGLIESDKSAWVEAKNLACKDFLLAVEGRDPFLAIPDNQRVSVALKIGLDPNYFPEQLRPRAEVIYGKLLIFSKLAKFQR